MKLDVEVTCEEQRPHDIGVKLSSLPSIGLWMKNVTALSLSFSS